MAAVNTISISSPDEARVLLEKIFIPQEQQPDPKESVATTAQNVLSGLYPSNMVNIDQNIHVLTSVSDVIHTINALALFALNKQDHTAYVLDKLCFLWLNTLLGDQIDTNTAQGLALYRAALLEATTTLSQVITLAEKNGQLKNEQLQSLSRIALTSAEKLRSQEQATLGASSQELSDLIATFRQFIQDLQDTPKLAFSNFLKNITPKQVELGELEQEEDAEESEEIVRTSKTTYKIAYKTFLLIGAGTALGAYVFSPSNALSNEDKAVLSSFAYRLTLYALLNSGIDFASQSFLKSHDTVLKFCRTLSPLVSSSIVGLFDSSDSGIVNLGKGTALLLGTHLGSLLRKGLPIISSEEKPSFGKKICAEIIETTAAIGFTYALEPFCISALERGSALVIKPLSPKVCYESYVAHTSVPRPLLPITVRKETSSSSFGHAYVTASPEEQKAMVARVQHAVAKPIQTLTQSLATVNFKSLEKYALSGGLGVIALAALRFLNRI